MAPRPSLESFKPRELGPKPWGRELLIAHTDHYIGKCLWMKAGTSGPLQYHQVKDETFYLFSGLAQLTLRDEASGALVNRLMQPGESYHVPPGAVHQVAALEECVFFEASTPVFDDRVAVQA